MDNKGIKNKVSLLLYIDSLEAEKMSVYKPLPNDYPLWLMENDVSRTVKYVDNFLMQC